MATHRKNEIKNLSRRFSSWFIALGVIFVIIFAILPNHSSSGMSALPGSPHSLTKRSYFDINCKGLYDKSIFARLDRICQDCYSLYREPELHSLCRSECFSTPFFSACLKVLLLEDQGPDFSEMIDKIGR